AGSHGPAFGRAASGWPFLESGAASSASRPGAAGEWRALSRRRARAAEHEVALPRRRYLRRGDADEHRRARRPRPALGMHASLAGEHAPLLAVARSAGGDDVLPHRLAAATSRDHVVDGQPRLRRAAVLTRPRIAREHRLAGDLAPMDVAG